MGVKRDCTCGWVGWLVERVGRRGGKGGCRVSRMIACARQEGKSRGPVPCAAHTPPRPSHNTYHGGLDAVEPRALVVLARGREGRARQLLRVEACGCVEWMYVDKK